MMLIFIEILARKQPIYCNTNPTREKHENENKSRNFRIEVTLILKDAEEGEIWERRGRQVRVAEACHAQAPAQPQGR